MAIASKSPSKLSFNLAFRVDIPKSAGVLITDVFVIPNIYLNNSEKNFQYTLNQESRALIALWDTGAQSSCIQPHSAKEFGIDNNQISFINKFYTSSRCE